MAIIQWHLRGLRANFEELQLLCKQHNPKIVPVRECQLRENKVISFCFGITKSSPHDISTGGVSINVTKSCLFSEIKLDTDLQAMTGLKALTN